MANDTAKPRCLHLTCKSMMVYGDNFENDPDYQSGQVEFTCTCTFTGTGPDGQTVGMTPCANKARSCFREF